PSRSGSSAAKWMPRKAHPLRKCKRMFFITELRAMLNDFGRKHCMRLIVASCIVLLLFTSAIRSQEKRVEMDDATKRATAKALEWLKDRQNADGSFSDGAYTHNTAITA